MEYLIRIIIKRIEEMKSKGSEVFYFPRKSVMLDPIKYNPTDVSSKKEKNGCI